GGPKKRERLPGAVRREGHARPVRQGCDVHRRPFVLRVGLLAPFLDTLARLRRVVEMQISVAMGTDVRREPADDLLLRVPELAVDLMPRFAGALAIDAQPALDIGRRF